MSGAKRRRGVSLAGLRALALALPGVVEGSSYGTPAFRVGKKFLARCHEMPSVLVLVIDPLIRDLLLEAKPKTFFITDHYRGHPGLVLVRLTEVTRAELAELLESAWQRVAPKRAVARRQSGE